MVKRARVINTYQINLYCDICGNRMERDNIVLTSYPPQFKYHCKVCGNVETSYQQYPYQQVEFDEGNAEAISPDEDVPNTVILVMNNDSIIEFPETTGDMFTTPLSNMFNEDNVVSDV